MIRILIQNYRKGFDRQSSRQRRQIRGIRQRQSGQIVVEYILILVVSVVIAFTLTNKLIDRDPDNPGMLIKAWTGILQVIAADLGD